MDLEHLISCITPEIYENLKEAIELGRWKDGRKLTQEQLESSMTAVIAYEAKHLEEAQRTGYIDRGRKAKGETCSDDQTQIVDIKPAPKS